METTLEVRWFVKGTPPLVVQRWFRRECPGELVQKQPEIREDLYVPPKDQDIPKFSSINQICDQRLIAPDLTNPEVINLKLREGDLELKLRQQQLGTQKFTNLQDSVVWEGNIEQWCKLTQEELEKHQLFNLNSILKEWWIGVYKEREQKVARGIESELTWLKINHENWWSVAFEMTQNHNSTEQDSFFKKIVNQACQTYSGPKLSANNSYSYSRWLQIIF